MNVSEVLLNNVASLALIPVVIIIVLKLKNTQIDSLKEQNGALREQISVLEKQAKVLGLFRISEVEKEFEAMKKFYERRKKGADRAKKELDKLTKKLEEVKSLSEADAKGLVELFKRALTIMDVVPGVVLGSHAIMTKGYISTYLYGMKGPIGDLWREYIDEGQRKMWQEFKEKKSSNST